MIIIRIKKVIPLNLVLDGNKRICNLLFELLFSSRAATQFRPPVTLVNVELNGLISKD